MKEKKNSLPQSVIAFTKYGTLSASVRHRYLAYSNYLAMQSLYLTITPLFSNKYFKKKILLGQSAWGEVFFCYFKRFLQVLFLKKSSCVIVHTEMTPYLPGILELILKLRRIPYIVDIDDALFHQYDKHPSFIVRSLFNKKIGRIMKHSTAVFAGNEYIASYAREWNVRKVKIIPTVVDLKRYPVPLDRQTKNKVFTIGWIGSPSTTVYLKAIAPALAKLCEDGKAQVCLIGAGDFELPNITIENIEWNEDSEVALMQQFDVGIMPLLDDPWARGKCGFKLIQYMACSIPVVASPVGVNNAIVEQGKNGFLASTIEEWTQSLLTLSANVNLRESMGKAGRKKVEQHYCLQVTAPKIADCLLSTTR